MTIELRCLGDVRLSSVDSPLDRVSAQPKRLALLAFLAAVPGTYQRRDTLLGLFWPEKDEAHARAALRTSLHFLRTHLGEGAILNRGDDDVGLSEARVWHDATEFQIAAEAGRYADAMDLYRGDFLPGFYLDACPDFDEWVERRRAELRALALTCAISRLDALDGQGLRRDAIAAAERACLLAPYDETLARRLMSLLDSVGDRARALEAYTLLRSRLIRELEAEPSPETDGAMLRIRDRAEIHAEYRSETTPDLSGPVRTGGRDPATPVRTLRTTPKWARVAVVAAVALTSVGSTVVFMDRGTRAMSVRLMVAPLQNQTGDASLDYVADGVSASVVGRLARAPGIRPVSSSSAPTAVRADPRRAALSLDADLGLSWTLSRGTTDYLVEATLVRVTDGARIWSCTCPLRMNALDAVEDALVRGVLASLDDGRGDRETPPAHEFSSPEGRLLYLVARYRWSQRTAAGYWEAARLLQEAIDANPTNAEAYAWLSNTYGAMATNGYLAPADGFPRAYAAARRALELDSLSAAAHASLGAVRYLYEWNWAAGETELRRAIELDPGYAEAHALLAAMFRTLGRYDRALPEAEAAARLDPLSPFYEVHVGKLMFCLGDEGTVRHLKRALQWDPNAPMARRTIVAWWVRAEEPDSALSTWLDVERTAGNRRVVDLIEARGDAGYAELARVMGAAAVRAALEAEGRGEYVSAMQLSNAYAQAGDRDAALTWLEHAVDNREPGVLWLRCNPLFDEMRTDPRLVAVERSLDLP